MPGKLQFSADKTILSCACKSVAVTAKAWALISETLRNELREEAQNCPTCKLDEQNRKRRLRILKSDLADTRNPKILAKYPHLGSPENIRQLKERIHNLKGEIT